MAPPVGIQLLKGKTPKWRVGKKLGSGACATVHLLEEIDGSPTEWAIKLAPVPQKKTKKGTSTEEVNDRLLYHESVMYQNQFQDIQGIFVPQMPPYSGPPASGETEGYRFLTMEKMENSLWDIVPQILEQGKSSSMINLGPVAVQLLKCVQAIQDRKHLVVDIKPENFMIASSAAGKGSSTLPKLASRIRILDLAMVQPWSSIGSHRSNNGSSGLAGTPMYASLNVHNGETPSRRDDLEALGYVIAELVMKLASGNAATELPWSVGKSDEEIGRLKLEGVTHDNSTFYKLLGGPSVVKILKEYLDTLRGYTFKKTPDYDDLAKLLSKIKIPTPKTPAPQKVALHGKRSTTISTAGKRVTRSTARTLEDSDDDENEVSPHKMARDDTYMETDGISNKGPLTSALSAQEVAPMDWEPMDENEDPVIDYHDVVGLTLVVDGGPHKGAAVNLIEGRSEIFVVGRNPTAQTGEVALALSRDQDCDDMHVKVELSIDKKLLSVKVTDLNSSKGSFVGNEKIRSRKSMKIYRGDAVRIGNSILRVKNLDAAKIRVVPRATETTSTSQKAAVPRQLTPQVQHMDEQHEELGLKRRGIRICVVDGPHRGESYTLEQGISESFIVGSNPSGKTGDYIALQRDKAVKANHVHLELYDHKKIKAVVVTDKSKGETRVNRDTIKKTRAFINDQIHIGDSILEIKSL